MLDDKDESTMPKITILEDAMTDEKKENTKPSKLLPRFNNM
jgi:hypothetical protein